MLGSTAKLRASTDSYVNEPPWIYSLVEPSDDHSSIRILGTQKIQYSKIIILLELFRSSNDPARNMQPIQNWPKPFISPLPARFFLILTESLVAFADRQLPTRGFCDLAELLSSELFLSISLVGRLCKTMDRK